MVVETRATSGNQPVEHPTVEDAHLIHDTSSISIQPGTSQADIQLSILATLRSLTDAVSRLAVGPEIRNVPVQPKSNPHSPTPPSGDDPCPSCSDTEDEYVSANAASNPQNSCGMPERSVHFTPIVNQIPPPTFNGDRGKAAEWLHSYDNIMSINGYDARARLARVSAYITGPGTDWFETSRYISKFKDWSDFKNRFKKQYLGISNSTILRRKLNDTRQQSNEHPSVFMARVVNLCRKVNHDMPDSEKIEYITIGLRDDVTTILLAAKPRTQWSLLWLQDFLQDLPQGTSHGHTGSRYNQQSPSTSNTANTVRPKNLSTWTCCNCDAKGHEMKDCPQPINHDKVKAWRENYRRNKGTKSQLHPNTM